MLHLPFLKLVRVMTPSSALFLNMVQSYLHPSFLLEESKTVMRNKPKKTTLYKDRCRSYLGNLSKEIETFSLEICI